MFVCACVRVCVRVLLCGCVWCVCNRVFLYMYIHMTMHTYMQTLKSSIGFPNPFITITVPKRPFKIANKPYEQISRTSERERESKKRERTGERKRDNSFGRYWPRRCVKLFIISMIFDRFVQSLSP